MPRRLAVAVALVAFAACILCGMAAGNTFAHTVQRALLAMAGTLAVGLVVGAMGRRMLEESVARPAGRDPAEISQPVRGDGR